MSKILSIIKNNNMTFYDYNTGVVASLRPRISMTVVASLAAALFFDHQSDSLLSAVVSVQAILVGFSFSVMFYILSGDSIKRELDSIEEHLSEKKLKALRNELFYNVSYFNLAAVASVLVALVLLSGQSYSGPIPALRLDNQFFSVSKEQLNLFQTLVRFVIYTIFYFMVVESLFTFIRTIGRVTYYFEKKLDT